MNFNQYFIIIINGRFCGLNFIYMSKKGFTLIELLIVIAIIAIIAGVVFVALNPLQRFQDARDSRRWSDITSVLSAIKIHQVDNGGSYLTSISDATAGLNYMIGTNGATDCDTCTTVSTTVSCVDLTGLVTAGYLGSVPVDPSSGTALKTLYYLNKASTGIVTVGSCVPEGGSAINVSR